MLKSPMVMRAKMDSSEPPMPKMTPAIVKSEPEPDKNKMTPTSKENAA